MSHKQIMLDLETMSLATDAAIISIGAVRFDLETGELGDTFYRVVNLKSVQRAGGRIDAETVMWWLQQGEEARKALTGEESVLIDTALRDFANWVREAPLEGIWGNGAGFDNVVLEGAYHRQGWTAPWSFYMNRCYRTISAQFPEIRRETYRPMGNVHHNAVDDAVAQALHLCALWKLMYSNK